MTRISSNTFAWDTKKNYKNHVNCIVVQFVAATQKKYPISCVLYLAIALGFYIYQAKYNVVPV